MGSTDRPNPQWVDRGKQAERNDPGSDGQEVPEELEHAARPVKVVLLRIRVPIITLEMKS